MRKTTFYIILLLALSILGSSQVQGNDLSSLSISLHDEPVEKLVDQVYEQSGYQLIFPGTFQSVKISAEYQDVSMDNLIKGVLKGVNYATVTVEEEKLIIVTVFGTFDGTGPLTPEDNADPEDNAENTSLAQFLQKYEEMIEIGQSNQEKLNNFLADPKSVDPQSNLPLTVMQDRFTQGENELKRFVDRHDSVDPFSNVPLVSIKSNAEENYKELDRFLNDPASLDPTSGRSIIELRKIAQMNEEKMAEENF